MPEYEWMFVVAALSEEQERSILDDLDGFVGGHDATTLVTVSAEGDDADSVGRSMVHALLDLGVEVSRAYYDLVGRSEIARRAGVTPQAVGNWARGSRQDSIPFPAKFALAGGGVWLWHDVHNWLTRAQIDCDVEQISYASQDDVESLNCWLAQRHGAFQQVQVHVVVDLASRSMRHSADEQTYELVGHGRPAFILSA